MTRLLTRFAIYAGQSRLAYPHLPLAQIIPDDCHLPEKEEIEMDNGLPSVCTLTEAVLCIS
jgi:hypothetical protein